MDGVNPFVEGNVIMVGIIFNLFVCQPVSPRCYFYSIILLPSSATNWSSSSVSNVSRDRLVLSKNSHARWGAGRAVERVIELGGGDNATLKFSILINDAQLHSQYPNRIEGIKTVNGLLDIHFISFCSCSLPSSFVWRLDKRENVAQNENSCQWLSHRSVKRLLFFHLYTPQTYFVRISTGHEGPTSSSWKA